MLYFLLLHRVLPKAAITRTTYPLEEFTKLIKTLPVGSLQESSSIVLSFDDATYDFYVYVYPLLKEHHLKALLAIPTSFILENTHIDSQKRLAAIPFKDKHAHLTWEELKEMTSSGHVMPISHGHTHQALHQLPSLEDELITSKTILEKKLNLSIDAIAFPFGRYNQDLLRKAKQHYKHLFRIGNASNLGLSRLNYRIPIESLTKGLPRTKLFFNWLINRLQGK